MNLHFKTCKFTKMSLSIVSLLSILITQSINTMLLDDEKNLRKKISRNIKFLSTQVNGEVEIPIGKETHLDSFDQDIEVKDKDNIIALLNILSDSSKKKLSAHKGFSPYKVVTINANRSRTLMMVELTDKYCNGFENISVYDDNFKLLYELSSVRNVALFSPDGGVIASLSNSEITTKKGETGPYSCVYNYAIDIINAKNGEVLKRLEGRINDKNTGMHNEKIESKEDIKFSFDGSQIAKLTHDTLHIWNVSTNETLEPKPLILKQHPYVTGFCFSKDGSKIIVFSRNRISIFNSHTLERIYSESLVSYGFDEINRVKFNRDYLTCELSGYKTLSSSENGSKLIKLIRALFKISEEDRYKIKLLKSFQYS